MDTNAEGAGPSGGLPTVELSLDAVIMAVTDEVPRILTVRRSWPEGRETAGPSLDEPLADRQARAQDDAGGIDALPFGPLEPLADRTLELGLQRWVREQTGLELGYVEQLYTFGDRYRDPRECRGGPRLVTVAYLALVHEQRTAAASVARWQDVYGYFPWEDWRQGDPSLIAQRIAPVLQRWIGAAADGAAKALRRERAEIAFGLGGAGWDGERVLERYELLYELGLAVEAGWDQATWPVDPPGRCTGRADPPGTDLAAFGRPMVLDHRRIVATALGRLRGKIKYRPVVFELLPPTFTLLQLQQVVEALAGMRLHKGNFRRLVETAGLVEGTGEHDVRTGGRPAELFQFRREVMRERRAPGVGLPAARRPG
jgi:hypothetical protein